MRLSSVLTVGITCLAVSFTEPVSAWAASVSQPGETVGLGAGSVLPEGLYFVTTPSYGNDRALSYGSTLLVNVPVLIWSTPWNLGPAHIELLAAAPSLMLQDRATNTSISAIYNSFFSAAFAFDLGNGFNFTNYEGFYTPVANSVNQNFFTYNNRNALTYTKDGWMMSAYTNLGITNGNVGTGLKQAPDYFNYDLTAQKSFGKLSLGVGGFGSFDISGISGVAYRKQSQFAVGPLVGYDFGRFTAQAYVTRDVATSNYFNSAGQKVYETRFWTRLIVPLWAPEAPARVVARY